MPQETGDIRAFANDAGSHASVHTAFVALKQLVGGALEHWSEIIYDQADQSERKKEYTIPTSRHKAADTAKMTPYNARDS